MRKDIVIALMTVILFLAATPVLAADPVSPFVVSVQTEKGNGQNEFIFKAAVSGVTPGDDRYQVLLVLADTYGAFSDSDSKLTTPMIWDSTAGAWTATRRVDKFGRDKTRRYRVAVRDTASDGVIAVGQDEILRDPGKAPPISRQEVMDFLASLSKEYAAKNYRGVMDLVSPDFAGDDFVLANAVRKDFQLLSDIDIRFTVTGVTANAEFATIQTNYRRSVTPIRMGQRLNDSGMTELALYKEKGRLKLYSMKKPLLFGLANGGAAATGIVQAAQNQNVIQIKKDGTVVVGPVESTKPTVKSCVEIGGYISGGPEFSVKSLILSSGFEPTDSLSMLAGPLDGDVCAMINYESLGGDMGETIEYRVYFSGGWKLLQGVTNINSVTSVPTSGYNVAGYYASPSPGTYVFAVHLSNGNYAVVEATNWVDNHSDYSVMVLYKYQPDGTRNF